MSRIWRIRFLFLALIFAYCPRPAPAPIFGFFKNLDALIAESEAIVVIEIVPPDNTGPIFTWNWSGPNKTKTIIRKVLSETAEFEENSRRILALNDLRIDGSLDAATGFYPGSLHIVFLREAEVVALLPTENPDEISFAPVFDKNGVKTEWRSLNVRGGCFHLESGTNLGLANGKPVREAIVFLAKHSLVCAIRNAENADATVRHEMIKIINESKKMDFKDDEEKNNFLQKEEAKIRAGLAKHAETTWENTVRFVGEDEFRNESGELIPKAAEVIERRKKMIADLIAAQEAEAKSSAPGNN